MSGSLGHWAMLTVLLVGGVSFVALGPHYSSGELAQT